MNECSHEQNQKFESSCLVKYRDYDEFVTREICSERGMTTSQNKQAIEIATRSTHTSKKLVVPGAVLKTYQSLCGPSPLKENNLLDQAPEVS